MPRVIRDIKDLKRTCLEEDPCECFLRLRGGLRSSKQIYYFEETNTFDINNEIDGTYEEDITIKEFEDSLVGEALRKGALVTH